MRSLLSLLLLALPALATAQIRVQPISPGPNAGTLRNPYVVYDQGGMPRAQVNTPQMGTVPSYQPLLTTPLGRPLGSDYGDPFGGRGVLGRDWPAVSATAAAHGRGRESRAPQRHGHAARRWEHRLRRSASCAQSATAKIDGGRAVPAHGDLGGSDAARARGRGLARVALGLSSAGSARRSPVRRWRSRVVIGSIVASSAVVVALLVALVS